MIDRIICRHDGDSAGPLYHDCQEGADMGGDGGNDLLAGRNRLHKPQKDQRRKDRHGRRCKDRAG